jgi:membrane fusion protein, multidrug efflux system
LTYRAIPLHEGETLMKAVLKRVIRVGTRTILAIGFAAGVVVLMLWLAGKFSPKVPMTSPAAQCKASAVPARVAPVRLVQLPVSETAVGTIRAVHETGIGSRLLARVMEINLKAGQKVKAGDVLVRLDDTDLQAKLLQAKAAVTSAEALRAQAAADEKRYASLIGTKTISQQQFDNVVASLRTAEADVHRTKPAVAEVEATLGWATIRSPIDGTIIDKKVDIGDMVTPGQLLVTLFDQKRMQLVATVRESLTHKLQIGQPIGVRIDSLGKQCSGTLSEIVPEAQSASRSFQVKVVGPCPAGIYPGMFGEVLIPLEKEKALVVPRSAVHEIGQLEFVDLVQNGETSRRAVRLGRTLSKDEVAMFPELLQNERYVIVLAGLREGEQVALSATSGEAKEARCE